MEIGTFVKSATILLAFQLVASASGLEHSAEWTRTQHGSTIVIRPTTANVDERKPHDAAGLRPLRIVGHRSIADFVNESLGFRWHPVVRK